MPGTPRDGLVTQVQEAMRAFMARAVLYQDAVARTVGMSATELQCAGLLLDHGPATAGELAERAGLTSGGAITGVIDRLERSGFAHRSRDHTDRRRVVVTADRERLEASLGPIYARVGRQWADYLAGLDEEQLAFAAELLAQAAALNDAETRRLRQRGDG